jgi:saposin
LTFTALRFTIKMKFALAFAAVLATAFAAPVAEGVDGNLEGTECVICEFLVKEVDEFLSKESSVIIKYLNELCDHVPDSLKNACHDFINEEGQALVNWILNEASPQNVCDEVLHLGCKSSSAAVTPAEFVAQINKDLTGTCDVCKSVIHALADALNDPATQSAITKSIEALCSGAGALSGICDAFVDKYAPEVISWLASKLNPDSVCKDIHVCSADLVDGQQSLLGAKKCTFGPAYWCTNEQTARECNAYEHCATKVWVVDA